MLVSPHVSIWSLSGLELVSNWSQTGLKLISNLAQAGLSNQMCFFRLMLATALVSSWSQRGLNLVSSWSQLYLHYRFYQQLISTFGMRAEIIGMRKASRSTSIKRPPL